MLMTKSAPVSRPQRSLTFSCPHHARAPCIRKVRNRASIPIAIKMSNAPNGSGAAGLPVASRENPASAVSAGIPA